MQIYKNTVKSGIFQKQEVQGSGDTAKGMYKGVHNREGSISENEIRNFSKIPKAKKVLGQNFLIDIDALSDISNSLDVLGKHIIEVGPGYGALTDYILDQNPGSLDLVELDRDMIKILEDKYTSADLAIHHIDILKFIPPYEQYSVIANIPYYITSPILFHFLYNIENSPDEMIIMMQEEVGEKILHGRARKPHHSFISLSMEEACEDIEIVRYVGRTSFDPQPRVDSIVLRFQVRKSRNREQEKFLMNLWKVAFAHPRKTLLSNMKGSTYSLNSIRDTIVRLGYDERVRAEAIRREDWQSFL
ncbi:ribosomal RNA small subunit methyltransferase A [Candidatus Gracilibacteria bacterium]|nr:ribosomal RNA small subunit methyltransferase A [Candidatus Gracilibacteria bacterium]